MKAVMGPTRYVDKLKHMLEYIQTQGLDPKERVAVTMILMVILLRDTVDLRHGGKETIIRAALRDFEMKMVQYL